MPSNKIVQGHNFFHISAMIVICLLLEYVTIDFAFMKPIARIKNRCACIWKHIQRLEKESMYNFEIMIAIFDAFVVVCSCLSFYFYSCAKNRSSRSFSCLFNSALTYLYISCVDRPRRCGTSQTFHSSSFNHNKQQQQQRNETRY